MANGQTFNGPTRREFARLEKDVDSQGDEIDALRDLFRDALVEVAGIKATVRFWAAAGSLVGAGVVAFAVSLPTLL